MADNNYNNDYNNSGSRLFMEIGIDDSGDLYVVDNSPYERWIVDFQMDIDHYIYERVLEYSEDDEKSIVIAQNISEKVTSIEDLKADKTFTLPRDGFYHYQKLIIPSDDHSGTVNCWSDGNSIYLRENDQVHEIDFDVAIDLINDVQTGNAFWFDDYVFSIYNLIKCYVLTEKQRIANWLKNNCKADCNTISTINTNADILMAAVTVLTYLISKRQFVEAYRLLNGLRTCNSLCKDFVDDIKGCGCGKSV